MKVVAFRTDPRTVDQIIDHRELTFAAEQPPPEAILQELRWEANPRPSFMQIPRSNTFHDRC
jgi:hypothetical protein